MRTYTTIANRNRAMGACRRWAAQWGFEPLFITGRDASGLPTLTIIYR